MLTTPTVVEKANRLLKVLVDKSDYFGFKVTIDKTDVFYNNQQTADRIPSLLLIGAAWALHNEELTHLLRYLEEEQLISQRINSPYVSVIVSAKGFAHIDRLKYAESKSMQGFCAMWFDDSVSNLWEKAIEPAIGNAGYQPLRIDKKEHVNRIDDEIFADIRRSRFVVADFTHGEAGVRGGVYFEAGFAQGLGLPVIWTCRSDMLSEAKLHFDIRQYNFLEWSDETLDEFKDRLQKRIEAILGRGAWKPDA
jgi:hypothetical protein